MAALAGTLAILTLPLDWILRAPLALIWLLDGWRELGSLKRGAARLHGLRLDASGTVRGITPDGRIECLELLSGSLVLKRLAWLRLRFPDGLAYGEFLRGDPGHDPQWRRLGLIWRHRRGAFGQQ